MHCLSTLCMSFSFENLAKFREKLSRETFKFLLTLLNLSEKRWGIDCLTRWSLLLSDPCVSMRLQRQQRGQKQWLSRRRFSLRDFRLADGERATQQCFHTGKQSRMVLTPEYYLLSQALAKRSTRLPLGVLDQGSVLLRFLVRLVQVYTPGSTLCPSRN